MTYSLHTLHGQNPEPSPPAAGWVRFASEVALFFGFFLLLFLLLAFVSYAPQDAAWTTSGAAQATLNRAGRLGAWIADLGYFLLGYSVWWCLALALMGWARLALPPRAPLTAARRRAAAPCASSAASRRPL